jgi:hypothetical protein
VSLTPPARPPIRKGICGAGPGPCGAPGARLYPCGWRCNACASGPAITRTTAVQKGQQP